MAVETGNWDFEDEETTNDSLEPPLDARDTPLDLTVEVICAMRDGVVKIEELSELPREEEVIHRICANANLGQKYLGILRKYQADGGLSFLECRFTGTSPSYVYIARTHQSPNFVRFGDNARIPLNHPGATVLLRVKANGDTTEVYRWQD